MITQKYNYTPLNRETIDGKRHCCLPDVVAGKVLEFDT
jgi:hypothetical protein